jgi:tripartite-type tricarboxylate transporter receptor subunit TctC
MKKCRLVVLFCSLIAILAVFSGSSLAEDWPTKPINLVLGWSAGGGADLTSRAVMQPFVEKILGTKIVISYKTGSGGEISFVNLKNSRPDGYNYAWTVTPHLVSFPVSRKTAYQLEDLCPVANIAYDPGVFAVKGDSQFNTLEDLVEYCKKNPGKVTFGNGGTGGDDFLAVLLFSKAANVDIIQVAYPEGTGTQISGLMGGHIDVAAFNASEAKQYTEGGQIKLLGVMSNDRVSIIPAIPTFSEQGYKVIMSSDRGFSAPAGTPKEIVDKFASAVEQAIKDPEFIKRAEKLNLLIKFMGPDEYAQYLRDYRENLKQVYAENPW